MNEFVIDERGNCSVCGGTHYGSSRRQCPLKSEMSIEENTAKPAVKPPRLVVIDRTMLVSAIACNTDASPPEAASIVNTVLYKQKQTSTDEFTFRLNDGNVKRLTLDRLNSMIAATVGPSHHLRGVDRMKKAPAVLDAIADRVLAYRPKPKSKPAKKRARQRKKIQRESCI